MTAPIIPAYQWPEWADRHCWDEDGCGEFYGVLADTSAWIPVYEYSDIPMPAGHDWRVPVTRSQPATAVDLEQFRRVATFARDHGSAELFDSASDLLDLIDGQAAPRPLIARQLAEWHEDDGPVTWWAWSEYGWDGEPAWCGTPNDVDWPGYHTHWTPHPAMPMQPTTGEGE